MRSRRQLFDPQVLVDGPDPATLGGYRTTHAVFSDGYRKTLADQWRETSSKKCFALDWTGITFFSSDKPSEAALEQQESRYQPRDVIAPAEIDLSKPWDGEEPPQPLDGDVNPDHFRRNKDGVWCRPDADGRLFPVDRVGQRWTKRARKAGGEARPPEISAFMWWKTLTSAQRKAYWNEKRVEADGHSVSAAAIFGVDDDSEDETRVPSDDDSVARHSSEESGGE